MPAYEGAVFLYQGWRLPGGLGTEARPYSGRAVVILAPHREREPEDRAMRLVRGRPNPPTVRLADRAADRQADADAFGFGRVERLEDSLRTIRIEPDAGIAYLDHHAVRALCRYDRQLARAIVHGAHCLDRVHDQVEKHLLKLHSIARHVRQRSVQRCLEHDVVAAQFLLR